MSEVNVREIEALYNSPGPIGDVAVAVIDLLAGSSAMSESSQVSFLLSECAKRKGGVLPVRGILIFFLLALEEHGAGHLISSEKQLSEFKWSVNPVKLARVITGELGSL